MELPLGQPLCGRSGDLQAARDAGAWGHNRTRVHMCLGTVGTALSTFGYFMWATYQWATCIPMHVRQEPKALKMPC
jgi:hypothetical protein